MIHIDWASIKALAFGKPVAVDYLVEKYSNVFSSGVGTMKDVRSQLSLREGSKWGQSLGFVVLAPSLML